MTFSLRRKHPTTAAPSTPAPTAGDRRPGRLLALGLGLGLVLTASVSRAEPQGPSFGFTRTAPATSPASPKPVLYFTKPAGGDARDATLTTTPMPAAPVMAVPTMLEPLPPLPAFSAKPSVTPVSTTLTSMQVEKEPRENARAPGEDDSGYTIQLEPPGRDRLFRLEAEASLMERMRQEARERIPLERIEFPSEPILSRERYVARVLPPTCKTVEPYYVCYSPLFFEERNAERYGWDMGAFQPLWSTLAFYKDAALLPYNTALYACRWYECSAGQCLPGDPVPYHINPPDLRVSATAAETAVVLGLLALFP